jgi:hypothetical protein
VCDHTRTRELALVRTALNFVTEAGPRPRAGFCCPHSPAEHFHVLEATPDHPKQAKYPTGRGIMESMREAHGRGGKASDSALMDVSPSRKAISINQHWRRELDRKSLFA